VTTLFSKKVLFEEEHGDFVKVVNEHLTLARGGGGGAHRLTEGEKG